MVPIAQLYEASRPVRISGEDMPQLARRRGAAVIGDGHATAAALQAREQIKVILLFEVTRAVFDAAGQPATP